MRIGKLETILGGVALIAALEAGPLYAERTENLNDYAGNLATATISVPLKLVHRPGREALKSADAFGDKVPVLGHVVGGAIGFLRGCFYGPLDCAEGVAEGVTGFKTNDPLELGDGSATFDSSVGGRVVATGIAGAGIGGIAAIAGGVGEGIVAGGVGGAVAQGTDEYIRRNHPDRNNPRAARLYR